MIHKGNIFKYHTTIVGTIVHGDGIIVGQNIVISTVKSFDAGFTKGLK